MAVISDIIEGDLQESPEGISVDRVFQTPVYQHPIRLAATMPRC